MFLNKKNKGRLYNVYSGIVNSLVSKLKMTAVFFYTALARLLLLNNNENRALEEHYPDAPQHWLNLIKRNQLNLNSFKRTTIKNHLRSEKAKVKENYFSGLEKTEKKIIRASSYDVRSNKSGKPVIRFSVKDKLFFSKASASFSTERQKSEDLHKTTEKLHFITKVNNKKNTDPDSTVFKFAHIKAVIQRAKEKIVTVAEDNDGGGVNKRIRSEQIKSVEKMAGKYLENIIDQHQSVSRMRKTKNNKHDDIFFSDSHDFKQYISNMTYKQQLKMTDAKNNILQQKPEPVIEDKMERISPLQEQHQFHKENEILINENGERYWQNLPDDVWDKLSLDKVYTFKKIPGNNNIREILWNG